MNDYKFLLAHREFLKHMQANAPNGEPFTDFEHPFLLANEIDYKRQAARLGREALGLDQWSQWKTQTGKILQAVKDACAPGISDNLLEHQYGNLGSPYKALYRVESPGEVSGLEHALSDFFLESPTDPTHFGTRFDEFATYLRANRLGCDWSFVAYLAFLVDPERYFPIRSTRFDIVLKLYSIPGKIAGYVSWNRYQILLDLADELKARLSNYGPIDAIAIQSYMWVLSYLLDPDKMELNDLAPEFNYDDELSKRRDAAIERERIGLRGEHYIFEQEVEQLKRTGKDELAARVRFVAAEDVPVTLGYDILSYTQDAEERHIEVKTTTRSPSSDNGFWLSDNEKGIGSGDSQWVIYRVWDIDGTPSYKNLGNLVQQTNTEWELIPATWYVKPTSSDA